MYGYIVRNIMNTLLQSGININSNKCKYFPAKGMLIMTEAGILETGIPVFFIKVCSIYHVNCKTI